jgi:hypothetical protein
MRKAEDQKARERERGEGGAASCTRCYSRRVAALLMLWLMMRQDQQCHYVFAVSAKRHSSGTTGQPPSQKHDSVLLQEQAPLVPTASSAVSHLLC